MHHYSEVPTSPQSYPPDSAESPSEPVDTEDSHLSFVCTLRAIWSILVIVSYILWCTRYYAGTIDPMKTTWLPVITFGMQVFLFVSMVQIRDVCDKLWPKRSDASGKNIDIV